MKVLHKAPRETAKAEKGNREPKATKQAAKARPTQFMRPRMHVSMGKLLVTVITMLVWGAMTQIANLVISATSECQMEIHAAESTQHTNTIKI